MTHPAYRIAFAAILAGGLTATGAYVAAMLAGLILIALIAAVARSSS